MSTRILGVIAIILGGVLGGCDDLVGLRPAPDAGTFIPPVVCRPTGGETCNAKDDDCNGVIDDVPYEFFMPYPPYGECRPGLVACRDARWGVVLDARGPSTEVRDCLDNDCDGEVDEGFSAPVDVAVVLDSSGSMGVNGRYTNAFTAVRTWALTAPDDTHIALVIASDPLTLSMPVALVPPAEFVTAWDDYAGFQYDAYAEPTLDGAALALSDAGWQEPARRLLIITDEEPQSYNYSDPWVATDIRDMAADAGVVVSVLTTREVDYAWDEVGTVFDVLEDYAALENALRTVTRGRCAE